MRRELLVAVSASAAIAAACGSAPPAVQVVSAEEVGVVPAPATIAGRDGGFSVLAWGRSVWTYGDTVLNVADVDGSRWHHNSFSSTGDLDAADGLTGFTEPVDAAGAPAYFLAPTDNEHAFNLAHQGDPCAQTPCGARFAAWPGPSVMDAARDRVLVLYDLVYAEPGAFNFHSLGEGLAVWCRGDAEPVRPILTPGADHPTLLFSADEPGFGAAALVDGNDLVAYACPQRGFGHACVVGRVPLASATDRSAWQFWNGTGWSARVGDAADIMDGAPIMDVSHNAALGLYTAIYSRPFSLDVVIRTAPTPEGPWSDERLLFHARDNDGNVYDALAHRELAQEEGLVQYVSYSRSTGAGPFSSEIALERVVLAPPSP